ncbi:MAG: hypothetical protein K2K17_05585 [Lachnospiraceae bacterium]|nr:hypothetical protein [Lachnospiraceae bacterium]
MAEDKSKTVIVKARAKAFLTSQPEENDPLTAVTAHKRTVSKLQKSAPSAAEIAAAIRKGEASEAVKNISVDSAADAKKSTVVVVMRQESVINRKNKLTEDGRVKKIPACKMAEPMKRPADDTLIISGRVVAASKKIQTPATAVAPAIVKAAKPEPEKTVEKPTAKPAVKKVEPKKTAAKSAVKKAEPKKVAAKPTAKKTAIVQNTYIQYQNETYKEADLVALAEKLWTKDMKRKAADLKSLELYVKPQERMAYCVFNKKETGSFAI